MAKILMVGAFDTKGPEYAFLREQILAKGHEIADDILLLLDQQIPRSSRRFSGEVASSQ